MQSISYLFLFVTRRQKETPHFKCDVEFVDRVEKRYEKKENFDWKIRKHTRLGIYASRCPTQSSTVVSRGWTVMIQFERET